MRNFLHYLISILLWILFGYYWYVVVERQISRESLQPLVILTGITGGSPTTNASPPMESGRP